MDFFTNSLNILGMIWLFALIGLACFRFNFGIGKIWPKLIQRKWLRYFVVFFLAFGSIYFFQILIDDLITSPIDLAFGSWSLLQPMFGAFTLWKWFEFKVDVYLNMALYVTFFSLGNLWGLFTFTKKSAFWLILLIAFQVFLAVQHNYNFRFLTGDAKFWAYWLSYPEFRIISGLFVASILRKQRVA
jgi:hypothetical protein